MMNIRTRQIWNLAIPSIVSNITVPLLGLVDVSIVGYIGDARYISAIAVGTMLFNVIYWIFGFLRMGTGGMTSQAYGRRDFREAVSLLVRTLSIGSGLGIGFILLQIPLIDIGLGLMAPGADLLPLCHTYCRIVVWGAPAVLSLYGLTGWFVGMQNTKLPMAVSITQNIINIVTSLLLVFVFRLDIAGVAWGTVIAQWSGFVMAFLMIRRHYGRLWTYRPDRLMSVFRGRVLRRFFTVNLDIFLRTLFLVSVFLSFTAIGSREGTMILAVNTLLMQFFTIFSYFMDGFAYAGEALGGKYHGTGNRMAFRDVVNRLFLIGMWVAIAFTLLYWFGGRTFLGLLTSDAMVVESAMPFFWWAVLIPLSGVAAFLFDGVFVGITQTKGLLWSSVVAAICFFMVYWWQKTTMANHALWLAFVVYLLVRGIVELIIYRISVCR